MKNIIFIFITISLFGFNNNVNSQSEALDEFTVKVDGLGCPFCAYGLEKKFKELKGIKAVHIEMETGVMLFDYPASKKLSTKQVEQQVEKAGYTPVSVLVKRADGSVESTAQNTAYDMADGEFQYIELMVAGNCDMCKSRIEKVVNKLDGIQNAVWDKQTKQLTVKASLSVVKEDIEKAVAKVGHDTENVKAKAVTYDNLPGCCQYERMP